MADRDNALKLHDPYFVVSDRDICRRGKSNKYASNGRRS
jgi:hypothetical protein